jgi:hypothetical protein
MICERAQHPEGTRRAPRWLTFGIAFMRAGFAPRAPHWGRSAPPNPLQLMLAAQSMHRHMPPLCSTPNHRLLPSYAWGYVFIVVETSLIRCRLISARRHARQALRIRRHRIGVRRGEAHRCGCRERGRSLPPPAQGNCMLYEEGCIQEPQDSQPLARMRVRTRHATVNPSAPRRSSWSSPARRRAARS